MSTRIPGTTQALLYGISVTFFTTPNGVVLWLDSVPALRVASATAGLGTATLASWLHLTTTLTI